MNEDGAQEYGERESRKPYKQKKPYVPKPVELNPDGSQVILVGDKRDRMKTRARNIILFQLGDGSRSRHQLNERLKKKSVPDDIIKETLDYYEELELINDTQFAASWAESRHRSKGLARMAIRQEMKYKKGISEEDSKLALESITDEDEYARATLLVEKKLRSTARLEPQKRIQRLVGMLARKGYGGSVAYAVVKEAIKQESLEASSVEIFEELDTIDMEE